jgi:hypothetical protein
MSLLHLLDRGDVEPGASFGLSLKLGDLLIG